MARSWGDLPSRMPHVAHESPRGWDARPTRGGHTTVIRPIPHAATGCVASQ
jgi:hypothetical protein